MSGWQELRAERNRRSLGRLNKGLPAVFPRAVLTVLLVAPSCRRPRGLRSSHTGAPIQFEPIAWREHLPLAAKRPLAGLGGCEIARAAYLPRSARHPRPSVNTRTRWGRDFAACAVSRYITSAGTLTYGAAVQTKTRSGTPAAWLRGNSGMHHVVRSHFCGAYRRSPKPDASRRLA